MPYMIGAAASIKQPRVFSNLRNISTKGGKLRKFKVSAQKIPVIKKSRARDFSLVYLISALVLVVLLSLVLVPGFGLGGIILPSVLVPTLFFIIGAVKSLVYRE